MLVQAVVTTELCYHTRQPSEEIHSSCGPTVPATKVNATSMYPRVSRAPPSLPATGTCLHHARMAAIAPHACIACMARHKFPRLREHVGGVLVSGQSEHVSASGGKCRAQREDGGGVRERETARPGVRPPWHIVEPAAAAGGPVPQACEPARAGRSAVADGPRSDARKSTPWLFPTVWPRAPPTAAWHRHAPPRHSRPRNRQITVQPSGALRGLGYPLPALRAVEAISWMVSQEFEIGRRDVRDITRLLNSPNSASGTDSVR